MLEQSNLDFLMYGAQTGNISLIFKTALNLINSVSEIIYYNIEKLYLGYSSII